MTILHCITLSTLGGAQSFVVNLANNQSHHHDVYIISSIEQTAWSSLDKRIHVIALKELKRKIGPLDFIVMLKLLFYRFKIKPDIIHLHSSKMGVMGRLAFPSSRIVYTVHGFDSIRIAHRSFLPLERILQNCCKFIVGVSKYDKEMLLNEGIKHNVLYIYNGIHDATKSIMERDSQVISYLENIKKEFSRIVFCIARDDAQKKPELFREISEKNPQYAFIWIGNSNQHSDTNNLFWAGTIQNAFLYLSYCDLFILPSNYEGLPISIIEALSFSKPVVASDVGGISELLDGENGFAVANNANAFSEKINYLLSDNSILLKAGEHARKTYEKDFSDSKMIMEYNCLYNIIEQNKILEPQKGNDLDEKVAN